MLDSRSIKKGLATVSLATVIILNPITIKNSFAANISSTRILKVGIKNKDVKQLQDNLKKLGYFKGNTTQYFGNQTKDSVRAFQKANGLTPDGIAGKSTINKINKLSSTTNVTKKKTNNTVSNINMNKLLKVGSRGNDVKQLQNNLKKLGYFKGNTTQYFGNQTKDSLKAFQKAYGLNADGIASKSTIDKINSALNGAKPKKKVTSASRGSSLGKNITSSIVSSAKNQIGVPYKYGGASRSGFDCSGFTQYVYRQAGLNIPRSSSGQAGAGQKVSKSNLQVGDLIIFSNTYRPGPSHTGIYLGNNNFIHASSGGKRVMISNLNSNYYKSKFSYGRRVD